MSRPKEKQPKKKIAGIFSTWQLVAAALCLVCALVCYVFFRLGSLALASLPEDIIMPEGGLGDTVFDAQNTAYTPDAEYPGVKLIDGTGYQTDVPDVTSAVVGAGTFYRLTDNYYIYITTYAESGGAKDACCSEVIPALHPGTAADGASCEVSKEDHGYYNGYEVTYQILSLSVEGHGKQGWDVVIGYEFADQESGKVVFLGAVTRSVSTGSLLKTQKLAAHEVELFRKVPPKKE